MSKFVKTENDIITFVPVVQRLYAAKMLRDEGIPCETVYICDVPEDVVIQCTFRGKQYNWDNILGVKAKVTSESLIKALEERTDN